MLHLVFFSLNHLTSEVRLECPSNTVVEGEPLIHLVFVSPNHITRDVRLECLPNVVVEGKPLLHHVSYHFVVACFDK